MSHAITLSPRHTIAPIAAALFAIALLAMLALGFGIRSWTEDTPAPAGVVTHVAPAVSEPPVCRVGRPC